MRSSTLVTALSVAGAQAIRILQSNDDGWAELYIRSLNDALNAAGHDVVLSAPADNQSGQSSRDAEPDPRKDACMYDSCPANSGPTGTNATNTRLNWVNSFPVTSARFGLDTFGPQIWGGEGAQLVVSGPNVGTNLFVQVPFSGTVGIAAYAAKEARVPAIAFSGASSGRLRWDAQPVPARSLVYAELAGRLVDAVVASGEPYLPDDTFLNVNFPSVGDDECSKADDFSWVLSRINPGFLSGDDVTTCGSDRLPQEAEVILKGGCRISVSVGDANDKTTASADKQAVVLQKLGGMLSCLK